MAERLCDNKRIINSTILESGIYFQFFDENGKERSTKANFRDIMTLRWYVYTQIYQRMMEASILDKFGRQNVPYDEFAGRFYWYLYMKTMSSPMAFKEVIKQALTDGTIVFSDWTKIYPRIFIDMLIDEFEESAYYQRPWIYTGKQVSNDSLTIITKSLKDELGAIRSYYNPVDRYISVYYDFTNQYGNPVSLIIKSNTDRVNQALERLVNDRANELILFIGTTQKLSHSGKLLFSIIYPAMEGDETT